jgi:hypothetical protein
MMFGQGLEYDICVGMSIGMLASDCSPEIADAVFPVKVNLPIKEGLCVCLVLLESG